MPVITGLDLSLTSSGICRIDTATSEPVIRTARITSKSDKDPSLAQRSLRLRKLAGTIFEHTKGSDLIVVEGPAYASKMGAAHDRAGLWWMIIGRLTGTGHNVVEVTPNSLKMYATGKGVADKDIVLAAVIKRYPQIEVTGNDVADAVVLAAMGARFAGHPVDPDLPQTHLGAMKAPKWAPTTT